MLKKSKHTLSPAQIKRMKSIQPVGTGLKNVGLSTLSRTIPKSFKVIGQKKRVKVNNWANAGQTPLKKRLVRFKINKNY